MLRLVLTFSLALFISLALTWLRARLMQVASRKRRTSSLSPQPIKFARKMLDQQSRLLKLPDEVLINIFRFLDYESLLEARLACSDLKDLAEPRIFEDYQIHRGQASEILGKLISRDPRRAKWLKSVLVSTRYDEDEGLSKFPQYLSLMRNIRSLILETPDCNSKSPEDRVKWVQLQKDYEALFLQSSIAQPKEERILPNLEQCTMHFVDENVSLYPLTKYSSIFLHPTLKSLTLSCACTDIPSKILRDHRQYERSTHLEFLHFEECDFNPDSLETLLRFPRSLKSLVMSEGVRYSEDLGSRRSRLHGNLRPAALSRALTNSVEDSLESLSLSLGFRRGRTQSLNTPDRSLDLTGLTKLKHLDLAITTLDLIRAAGQCDHQFYRRLPPSLESIRVFSIPILILRGRPANPFQTCVIKEKKVHGLPNLKHIIYRYEYQAPRGRSAFGLIQPRDNDNTGQYINKAKANIQLMQDKRYHIYKKYNVRVTLEVEVTPPGYIPPYLHNEEKPYREILWDSNSPTTNALQFELAAQQQAATVAAQRLAAGEDNTMLSSEDPANPSSTTTSVTSPGPQPQIYQNATQLLHMNDDDDDDVGAETVGNLNVDAAEILELLVNQPGQPFQL